MLSGPDFPPPTNGFVVSRFKRALAGSVLAAALVAVPVAPVALASHATPAATAVHTDTFCVSCWP